MALDSANGEAVQFVMHRDLLTRMQAEIILPRLLDRWIDCALTCGERHPDESRVLLRRRAFRLAASLL